MNIQDIKNTIRNIPDYPKIGIQFKDITTTLKHPQALHAVIDLIAQHYKNEKIDYIAGIEARGFIFGSALAYTLNCGFIPIRKSGKLPAQVLTQEYDLEYGTDKIEIHRDAVEKGAKVLIIDDLLATGGTAEAAAKLMKNAGAEVIGFAFMVELSELNGRSKLDKHAPVFSLIQY